MRDFFLLRLLCPACGRAVTSDPMPSPRLQAVCIHLLLKSLGFNGKT